MATRHQIEIDGGGVGLGGGSAVLNTANWVAGNPYFFDPADWEAVVSIEVNQALAAVSGDVVEVRVDYANPDLDWLTALGGGPSTIGGAYLTTLDLYSTAAGGRDRRHVPIDTAATGFRLYYRAPNGGTRPVTVVQTLLTTHRGAIG